MKKSIQATLAAMALAGSMGAMAAPTDSFDVASGTTFTQYFTFTPTLTNQGVIAVSGLSPQFTSLSFELLGGPVTVASVAGGMWAASFVDSLDASFNMTKDIGYTLKITGQTASAAPGGNGRVSITSFNGSISPVPEPETYAMFLAGLGLMAAIARRRSNKA